MLKYLIGFIFCASAAVAGAEQFPDRPITLVVPFSPGGTSDVTARPLAEIMSQNLGQSIIVQNKPGAGGAIGMAHATKAKPDGYTLLMALPSISIIPAADRVSGRTPLYSQSQLEPIARITADPTVFAVHASSPWKTLDDFVQDAKKNPGKISYSTSGIYGTTHIAMEMFAQAANIKLLHAPYPGGGQQVMAVVSQDVQSTPQALAPLLPHIKSGKLRVLAVWGSERLSALPDVPSMKELGYDVQFQLWTGIFVPTGTPTNVINRLRDSVRKAVHDPKFVSILTTMQTPIQYLDTDEFKKFLAVDSSRLEASVINMGKLQ
ncbi:MAG TPA: tripartite tricarboxylate transporter substrate binding protein [Eoetvoesiella sp.]